MKTTLQQLIKNPSGSGTAYMASRKNIIENLDYHYEKLVDNKKFRYQVYSKDEVTIFHIQVPSETLEKPFYFDVVLEVDSSSETAKTILNAPLKIFSNSPAFIFNYAFVARKEEMLIEWLSKKINKKALTLNPDVKNPPEVMGFEKSIYFAIKYVINNKLFSRETVEPEKLNKKEILSVIDSDSDILTLYTRAKKAEALKRKKQKLKDKEAKEKKAKNSKPSTKSTSKTVKRSSSTIKTKSPKKVKSTLKSTRKK